ncbi:TetR family transcriptional regulator [Streptomyces triculaminicus]|uniref:TetR family transcriptional regulator n=3 Tax=Streptomyces TaxID=1883 RepID=A0A939FI17_9ACTN|nr:TetR family transcriptional regulator [Streptomyces triculaminicus]QSY47242.1 TetR family transcriptional regulator [Streptomyces griseocarneus]
MAMQDRAARTRRELIRCAAAAFEQHGFARTTLNDVCRRAGVSSGALHFHFDNKEALADAVEAEASAALHRAGEMARVRPSGALQALVDASHSLAAVLREDSVVRAGFRLSYDTTRTNGLPLSERWHSCVRTLLAAARDEGALAGGVPMRDAAVAVTGVTVGLAVLSHRDRRWAGQTSLTGFWRLMLPQLACPKAGVRPTPVHTASAAPSRAGGGAE